MKRLLQIEPGEGPKVLALFLYLFCIVGIGIAGKSARDSYFLSRYERSLLPMMLVGCAASVVLAVTIYTWLARRMGRRAVFHLTTAAFVVSLLLLSLRLQGWAIPALYVWIDVITEITGLQFWLLAADIFNPREAKRLYGPIGAGSALAGVVVGFGLKPFVHAFGAGPLLYLVAGMVAASWIFALLAGRYVRPDAPAVPAPRPRRGQRKRLDPYLSTMALVTAVAAVASLLVDYQFKIIAARSIASETGLATFFGQFYACTGIVSLGVQFLLSSLVLSRYGVLAGLMILPVLLNTGSFAILLWPTLVSAVFAKGSDQTFKHTLNRAAQELLWLPVPPERRQAVKPFIGSAVKSSAEAAAGLATFFLVKAIALQYLSLFAIAATAVGIYGCVRLKPLYVAALARAIEKRRIDFEELTIDVQDPAMVAAIRRALESGDTSQRLFVLDLIAKLSPAPWADTLQELVRSGPAEVRKRVLELAGQDRAVLPDAAIEAAMEGEDGAAPAAILAAGKRGMVALRPRLDELLGAWPAGARLAAAAVILGWKEGPLDRARAVLAEALGGAAAAEKRIALELLAGDAALLTPATLRECLGDASAAVRETALEVAAKRKDASLVPAVVANLGLPATAVCARQALQKFAPAQVLPCLADVLGEPGLAMAGKIGIVRALRAYADAGGVALLIQTIERGDLVLYGEIADALLAVARRGGLAAKVGVRLATERGHLIRAAYACNRVLCLLPEGAEGFLLRERIATSMGRIVPLLLKLGAVGRPDAPIETCIQIVRAGDAARLPFVLEFLESIFPHAERSMIYPLIEPMAAGERDEHGRERFPDLAGSLDAALAELAGGSDRWESVLALDYLWRTGRLDVLRRLDWARVPDSRLCRELLGRWAWAETPRERWGQEDCRGMYSTLEKTIFLKSVDLFGRIPAETLSRIAQVTEEKHWPGGTPIFRDGDQGSSLFIVVDGTVEIHKRGRELAVLRRGACFGEMYLLDSSPRSADATAGEECTLFEIGEADFYEVLSGNVEIAQGVIRLLTERLREANRKLTAG